MTFLLYGILVILCLILVGLGYILHELLDLLKLQRELKK